MFTVYDQGFFSSSKVMELNDVVDILRSSRTQNMVTTIRSLPPQDRARLKSKLPVAMFSGTFTRNPNGSARISDFLHPSGFMVLDYDHIADLAALRDFLVSHPATALVFTSPGGEGIKAVVAVCPGPVDTSTSHSVFEAVKESYTTPAGEPDESGKNLNRPCFLGYDDDLYFNPSPVPVLCGRHSRALSQLDPDESYEQWLKVLMALHSEAPEQNLELAHAWSKRGAKYDFDALESRWNSFTPEGGITIRELYELAGMPEVASALISIDEEGLELAIQLLQWDIYWNVRTQRLTYMDNALSFNAQDSVLVKAIAQRCSTLVGRSERPARFNRNQIYDWLPSVVPHRDLFLQYLESLPEWDLDQPSVLMSVATEILGIKQYQDEVSELFMKWMLGIVTLQYDNRAPLDFAPILVGRQGSGKTRFVKELLPLELRPYYVDISLTETHDTVKLLEKVIGCVIVEFSELQEGSKIGIGSLRSLLSSTSMKARLAYRHDAADYPVTWGIMGTANPGTGVLPESAEGRRWYALEVGLDSHQASAWLTENRDKLWAEALARYRGGQDFHLSPEVVRVQTRLNEGQEKPEYKATREFIAANAPFDVKDLKEAAGVGQRLPRFMQAALSQAGWRTKVVKIMGRSTTAYFPPDFNMDDWKEGILMIEQSAGASLTFDNAGSRN